MDPDCRPAGHRALRRGRWSCAGQVFHITTCTFRRRRIFADADCALAAAARLASPQSLGDARLLAWVLMPDHMHLLLELGWREPIHRVVGRIKTRSALAANSAAQTRGPVWARGYHDRALRQEEDLVAAARYIIANPLRAGLATRVGDYPYWDAVWLQTLADTRTRAATP